MLLFYFGFLSFCKIRYSERRDKHGSIEKGVDEKKDKGRREHGGKNKGES